MLESKPTSMPPSPLSRTIGNFAMTTISGTRAAASAGHRRAVPDHAGRRPATSSMPAGEHAEVEPAAARGEQRSERSGHESSGSDGASTSIEHGGAVWGF